jgi:tetratricopeptide (TPR) repeat protein
MQNQVDIPQIKNLDWIRSIPHMLAILLAALVFQILHVFPDWLTNFLAGWLLVIVYRYIVRFTITKHHVKGLQLVKAQKFSDAAVAFQKSLDFFESHPYLDKWRSVIFLSPGKYGYREMALLNLGYVYGQISEGDKAEQCYKQALGMNPHNGAARAALNLLNAKQSSSPNV